MKNEYAALGRKQIIGIIAAILLLILVGAGSFLVFGCHVTKVTVVGNEHYSDKEVKEMVLAGNYTDNSLLLAIRYRNKSVEDIPFVESMDVEVVARDAIKITMYEKALAGCVKYLGRYMYFDREGIVVESSEESTEGIPEVTGLVFDSIVIYEPLPVGDDTIFARILTITQLLDKYSVISDKIHFDKNGNIMLYYDTVRVSLGTEQNLDEKIMELPYILPELTGKKGVLRMEEYDGDSETVTFELDE